MAVKKRKNVSRKNQRSGSAKKGTSVRAKSLQKKIRIEELNASITSSIIMFQTLSSTIDDQDCASLEADLDELALLANSVTPTDTRIDIGVLCNLLAFAHSMTENMQESFNDVSDFIDTIEYIAIKTANIRIRIANNCKDILKENK